SHKRISRAAHGARALSIEVDQNRDARFHIIDQRLSQCPTLVLVHLGVLEKRARLHSRKKIISGKKAVIFAVDLPRAWRTGGAGNGINEIGRLAKGVAQRRLTGARWRGDNK